MRQERIEAARRRDAGKWIFGALFVLLLMAGTMYAVVRVKERAPGALVTDQSIAIPIINREHITVGAEHSPYNSNPPTSGWHYGNPAPKGFHETSVPDEAAVHNLEHGDIWVAYHPRIATSTKESLRALAVGKVFASPREQNEFDISLVAWGRLDSFNVEGEGIDIARVTAFVERYRNMGPEKVF